MKEQVKDSYHRQSLSQAVPCLYSRSTLPSLSFCLLSDRPLVPSGLQI